MKPPQRQRRTMAGLLLLPLLLGACGKDDRKAGGPPAALVSATQAQARTMQVLEKSVGEVDSQTAPLVSAEVSGRVVRVLVEAGANVKAGQVLAELEAKDYSAALAAAEAEVKRGAALLDSQQKLTERHRELIKRNFISPARLEETEAQLAVQQEALNAAKANRDRAALALARARVTAPVTGRIDSRQVSAGDYVAVGKPLFQITTSRDLRVRLPFPETAASRIKPGMKVLLESPVAPDRRVAGTVTEVRPMVGTANRAFDAIVLIANPGEWKPGGSVDGAVVVEQRENAVVVPETSIVIRPAGKVVYLAKDGKAHQRIVKTGAKEAGWVEVRVGLTAGETVVVDGAGFLTDGAAIAVKGPEAKAEAVKQ
jgi:RND family efflux transporter MFP subunit